MKERDDIAKEITDIVMLAASACQKAGLGVKADDIADMTLRDIAEVIGHPLKCKDYATDVMDMVLSYAESVHDAGGAVHVGGDFYEMVTNLAHNGIRFKYKKPKNVD